MNNNIICRISPDTERRSHPKNELFIRTVLEEDRRVKELHQQEIQSTAENPRIRDQNETTDISSELKALKHDEFVRVKRRQQLRQNNHELRQLELQLQSAVISKQLALQRSTFDDRKKQEATARRKENAECEQERLRNLEYVRQEEAKARVKKLEFRGTLLDQMKDIKQRRLQDYTDVMKDRDNMQALLRQFELERQNEREEIKKRKEQNRLMMETCLRETAEHRERMRLQNTTDDKVMLRMLEDAEAERTRQREERFKRQELHAELSNRIGRELFQMKEEKRKREELLLDLLVEERNAKEDMRYRNELEKQEELRMQMRSELERYIAELEYMKTHSKNADEDRWLKQLKIINAEKDKQEELNLQQQRQKILEYRRGILEIMEERRLLRGLDIAEERAAYEQILKEQRLQDEEIEQERLRMLKSCPADLLQYLPAGVLRETDRELLALPPNKEKK